MMPRLLATGAMVMFFAVAAGAFGAHALKDRLDEYSRSIYEKAVFYHFIHGLALIIVAHLGLMKVIHEAAGMRIGMLLLGGILIFSGSLYLLAVTGMRWLGAITPIGGTLFLIAWIYLAIAALYSK